MIQFNLLPDVKLHYIKARRVKRLVVLISGAVAAVCLTVFILLFIVVNGLQAKHINDLKDDIGKSETELKNIPDLDKILTIQNQLNTLSSLHDKKPVANRLFTYLAQLTPAQASIGQVSLDFEAKTLNISGTADNLVTVNKFVDTLKFTKYTVGSDAEQKQVFSKVVLGSFGREAKSGYQISMEYDGEIFNSAVDAKLIIPSIISTRSSTEKPADLFQKIEKTETKQ